MSLPHLAVNSTPEDSERFFSSGNERTPANVTKTGHKAGYYLEKNDQISLIVDLMNMNPRPVSVYMTMTYEYIPTKQAQAQSFSRVKPVWLDADDCGTSEIAPLSATEPFTIKSKPWKAAFPGTVLGMAGHLHDGGMSLDVLKGGYAVCESVPTYGGTAAYVSPAMHMDTALKTDHSLHSNGSTHQTTQSTNGAPGKTRLAQADQHISHMSSCYEQSSSSSSADASKSVSAQAPKSFFAQALLEATTMTAGSSWSVAGTYDFSKQPGMLNHKGKEDDIMVIALLYVALPPNASIPA
jgi:hypothetical protein